MSDFLDLANHADAVAEPLVLGVLGEKLGAIDYYYEGLPGRAAYRVFARGRLNPVLARLGGRATGGDRQRRRSSRQHPGHSWRPRRRGRH